MSANSADPEGTGSAGRQGLPVPLRGIAYMLIVTLCGAAVAGLVRHISASLHPFEIAFFRQAFAIVILAPWILRHGLVPLRTRRFRFHALRALVNAVSLVSFFYAVSVTSLDRAMSLSFTVPLFTTLLAVVFLGERVGARRWMALAVGFAGTLVIIRPGFAELDLGTFLVLLSSGFLAVALIGIKSLTRTDSALTITALSALLMMPWTLAGALFVWQWPTAQDLAWLFLMSLMGTTAHIAIARAFRLADASVVMTFDFTKLIWASLIGYFAFAEVPSPWTWAGGAVILASTSYIAYREGRARRKTAVSRAP